MRALLDTHAFLWWVADSKRLSATAHRTIEDEANDIVVSAVSAWEIATKFRLGRLPEADAAAINIADSIASQGFGELAISVADAERARAIARYSSRSVRPNAHRPGPGA